MRNYDLDRAASKARSIDYETDISRAKSLASDIHYHINSADSYIIRLEDDLSNATREAADEKKKNDLLEDANERLKKELEKANALNDALTARIALKEIYGKSGSEWYSSEGSSLASKIRNSVNEFENNNEIDIRINDVTHFNSAYEKIELNNESFREEKRKNTAIAFIKIAENELTMEAVSKAKEKISLIQNNNIKKALLGELSSIERRINSRLKRQEVVNGIKSLIKGK